jgi:pyruvate formate lyase activating enzyme
LAAPEVAATAPASQDASALAVAGLQRFSTLDWPGRLSAVVFLQGCPWRCGYCHNASLQPRGPGAGPRWPQVLAWLHTRRGLLDAVVFSGGEPTLDPALPAALGDVRALGFQTGLHSAGLAPRRLQALLPLLDWVGLDIKADPEDAVLHQRLTGRAGAHRAAQGALAAVLAQVRSGALACECRTTLHPAWHDDAACLAVVARLQGLAVPVHVLQIARGVPGLPTPPGYPGTALRQRLQAQRPDLVWRGIG